jgi:TonB-dependent starch-binding outer membrane protein SusC
MKENFKILFLNYLKIPSRLRLFFRLFLVIIAVEITAFNFTANAQAAQRISVSGTVIDGSTGEVLPAVNIVVQGTQIGMSTDLSGKFTINVPSEESILVFTFIGYTSQSITVG